MDNVERVVEVVQPYFARMSPAERFEVCSQLLMRVQSVGRPAGQRVEAGDVERLRRLVGAITIQMMAPPDPEAGGGNGRSASALICPCCNATISVSLHCEDQP